MPQHYYTYYSYEEWGRGYIGSRQCKCLPEKDIKYFGSYRDKTFKPTQKIILTTHKTRKEALVAEMRLHEFYEVHKNPHFANQAKQTSEKFYVPTEQAKKHGKKLYEHGIGFHGLTEKEKTEVAKKGGKIAHELGLGIHAQTKEERIKNGKKGGQKILELGLGVHARTKEQMIEHGKRGGKISAEKKAIEFVLIDPQGNIYKGKNVNQFCEKRDLHFSSIYRVIKGIYSQHKGWTTPNIFLHEFNIDICSYNLKERVKLIERFLKTKTQISAEKRGREFVLIDPEGNIHKGKNIKRFCEKYKLRRASITKVLSGKLNHYKGWTKP